jgi:hypothetical protein
MQKTHPEVDKSVGLREEKKSMALDLANTRTKPEEEMFTGTDRKRIRKTWITSTVPTPFLF